MSHRLTLNLDSSYVWDLKMSIIGTLCVCIGSRTWRNKFVLEACVWFCLVEKSIKNRKRSSSWLWEEPQGAVLIRKACLFQLCFWVTTIRINKAHDDFSIICEDIMAKQCTSLPLQHIGMFSYFHANVISTETFKGWFNCKFWQYGDFSGFLCCLLSYLTSSRQINLQLINPFVSFVVSMKF